MGRRDAVQVTLEVIGRMRQLEPRLIVSYEPGWETRGNGTSANYEGAIVHHTASASSLANPFPTQGLLRTGRSDLPGPLCNEAGPACTVEQPRIHVMAANPANHAGASGGRAMGPLPVTSLFNPRVRGLEVDYAGTVPMLAGQLYVAHLWSRANADVVGGGDINRVRAHFETSVTGKWDVGFAPGKSYDMAAFRRDAAALRAAIAAPAQQKEPDLMYVSLPPGEHMTFPRPNGGQVGVKIAYDNNGTPGLAEGEQRARVGIHSINGAWRPVFPGSKEDALAFWLPQGETRAFDLTPFDDILVIKNLHTRLNLGVTITHVP